MSLINPSIGIVLTSSTALLTSLAILITNEHISKLKTTGTILRDWFIVLFLLYEKTLEKSMIDKKNDQKEAEQLKQIYNQNIDKRSEILENTQFKFKDVFSDLISKGSISPEQITKLKIFLAKLM